MGLFDKVRNVAQQMTSMLDEAKARREIERYETDLQANPENVHALQELSALYQEIGETGKAVDALVKAAEIHRRRQALELALGLYRRAERLAPGEQRLEILKQLIELYLEAKRYEEAYQHLRQAVDKLLAQKQLLEASALVNGLPSLGKKDQLYRGELLELVKLQTQSQAGEASGSWLVPGMEVDPGSPGSAKIKEKFPEQTLLLVDDDPDMLELLQSMFLQFGCRMITACDGQDALKKAAEFQPTLIVSDLVMPKMDGSQLFMELRRDPNLCDIPFVCLSSRGQEVERVAALSRGVEEYWVKPFNPPEILLKMRNLFKRLRPPADMSGKLSELSVVELLHFLEARKKSGMLTLHCKPEKAYIYLQNGRVMDAMLDDLRGRMVVYRAVYWLIGDFEFRSMPMVVADTVGLTTHNLVLEAMRRYDQAQKVLDTLPDLARVYKASAELRELVAAEQEFAANINRIITLFNGKKTLGECVAVLAGDLESLVLVHSLIEQLLLVPQG
ncbi:MAG: response regulator [Blastocatellia bacterium]|nr:response regulator [Blastocatellia bacterium]